jgi:hypothetical protein
LRRASAAYDKAADTASLVKRGCASRICSTVSPAASFSRISSTVIRVPVTTGFPIITEGLDWMRFVLIVIEIISHNTQAPNYWSCRARINKGSLPEFERQELEDLEVEVLASREVGFYDAADFAGVEEAAAADGLFGE